MIQIRRGPEGMRYNQEEGADDMQAGETMSRPMPRKSSKGPWILVLTIVIVLAVLGIVFSDKLFPAESGDLAASDYQAVFLTNGQVYFGKMSQTSDQFMKLNNIYYLQVTPTLQTQGTVEGGSPPPTQQQLSLVKLGNELHGPVDEMFINRDHVLFLEDLKDDGRVDQAIAEFEAGEGQ